MGNITSTYQSILREPYKPNKMVSDIASAVAQELFSRAVPRYSIKHPKSESKPPRIVINDTHYPPYSSFYVLANVWFGSTSLTYEEHGLNVKHNNRTFMYAYPNALSELCNYLKSQGIIK